MKIILTLQLLVYMKSTTSLLAALLFTCASIQSKAQEVLAAEPVALAVPTVGETNALIGAINKYRADLGIPALVVDPALSARAALAFPAVLDAPGEVDVTAIRNDFGAKNVGVLRGVVTHRRESSGAEFPKYWAKEPQWNALMLSDFNSIGAATAKRSDGKLVAFVYLIQR